MDGEKEKGVKMHETHPRSSHVFFCFELELLLIMLQIGASQCIVLLYELFKLIAELLKGFLYNEEERNPSFGN